VLFPSLSFWNGVHDGLGKDVAYQQDMSRNPIQIGWFFEPAR
jgi:hypothetical protein